MKHLSIIIIVVSLCVFLLSIGVYHKVPWSVLPIVASGICILCWLLKGINEILISLFQ